MAKKNKNSNYVTDKTIAAKNEKEAAKEKVKKDKLVKTIVLSVGIPIVVIGLIVGILFATGAFEYSPEPTYHATFSFDDGSSLHIELYGNDAPETVKHFIQLCEDGHFDGRAAHTFMNDRLFFGIEVPGSKGIKGEFKNNGFDNKVPTKKGVICMARGEDYDSAYGQFFLLTKNSSSVKGDYAAFGKITDLSALDGLLEKITVTEDGRLTNSPKITDVSLHAAHH